MMSKARLLIAMAGAGTLTMAAMPASALTVPPMPSMAVQEALFHHGITEVRHRNDHRHTHRHWDRKRHGDRCRTRHGNCRHYYRGYYYATPWWTLPLIGGPYFLGAQNRYYDRYGNAHVEWCIDRYRSYNVRTNTWVSYSGQVRQCISPYM